MNYDNMRLSELEREAWRTDNKLALAILKKIDQALEQPDLDKLHTYIKERL